MKKGRGLKIGVIGVGTMGEHHARIFSTLPGAKLTAVADLNEERALEVGKRYDAKAFTDYTEMFSLVEAISLATPTETHFKIGSECINAGKHLLIEKPLAKTSEEAKKLLELAKSKELVLAVGLIERFNPAFQELCKLIRKEKIIGINIKRLSPFPERITDTNVIQDMMIHDLDLLVNLLPKDEIETLKAEGCKVKSEKLDKVSASIYFNSGIIARLEANRVFGIKSRKIAVITEKGMLEADLLSKRVYVHNFEHHIPSIHFTKSYDQLTAELADFVKSVKNRTRPKVDAEDGYRALKLAEEVERACS